MLRPMLQFTRREIKGTQEVNIPVNGMKNKECISSISIGTLCSVCLGFGGRGFCDGSIFRLKKSVSFFSGVFFLMLQSFETVVLFLRLL